jgi:5-formaminoimidazole-4-carboxamide-1-beta-D-ribofuranosyl 5'-monophosphate synthetase
MTDRSQFYELCLKRLLCQGIEPKLASQVAQIQAYVDGTRKRSHYEQSIVDRVWEQLTVNS